MSTTQNRANAQHNDYLQNLGQAGAQARMNEAAQIPKQEGLFTQRIRSMAGMAEDHDFRLRSLLRNLRVAPPEPVTSGSASSLTPVHTTVEEQLDRHEAAQSNITAALTELEGLLA